MGFKLITILTFLSFSIYSNTIPDFKLYLYYGKNDEKLIQWNKVFKVGEEKSNDKINLLNFTPIYINNELKNYSKFDLILSVESNVLKMKTKSINKDYSLLNYNIDNSGVDCINYEFSILNKPQNVITRIKGDFCYSEYITLMCNRVLTYNTGISNFSINNPNNLEYLFIFDKTCN